MYKMLIVLVIDFHRKMVTLLLLQNRTIPMALLSPMLEVVTKNTSILALI